MLLGIVTVGSNCCEYTYRMGATSVKQKRSGKKRQGTEVFDVRMSLA